MNNSVTTQVYRTEVIKTATTPDGMERISREHMVLKHLSKTACVAEIYGYLQDDNHAELTIEHMPGESMKTWLQLTDTWDATMLSWDDAKERIGQYIDLEMTLLSNGVMYRDLNLEHVIFTDTGARIIDLEASIVGTAHNDVWRLDNTQSDRGTWETMALEEFRRPALLTERTATYRAAVVAHLAPSGELPFVRRPRKHDTHKWRATHEPAISDTFKKPIKTIFVSALAREPSRRHKSPESFLAALTNAHN